MAKRLIFLLGGARSGKSYYAEQWAREHGERVLFVATAEARDADMQARIDEHQRSRPAEWHTLEAPVDIAPYIEETSIQYDTLLLDCITVMTSNVLLYLPDAVSQHDANEMILRDIDRLLDLQAQSDATWLVVSNEVGMGVVPPTRLGNLFRDMLGRANQRIAEQSDEVWLLVAGLPWRLK